MKERITEGSWVDGGGKVERYENITSSLDAIRDQIDAGDVNVVGRIDLIFKRLVAIPDKEGEPLEFSPDEIPGARAHLADLMELAIERKLVSDNDLEEYNGYIKELRKYPQG